MSSGALQPVPILLPQAGNSMEEGTIISWKVQPGQRVRQGEILFELETDKAAIEVEAEVEGRLSRILVAEGQTAAVKTPVAYLCEDDEAVEALLSGQPSAVKESAPQLLIGQGAQIAPSGPHAPSDVFSSSRKRVSPVARKAADKLGVNLDQLVGTGPDGRVMLKDVTKVADSSSLPTPPHRDLLAPVGERRPMSKMRKAIAKNLTLSKQTLPHWYLKTTIDAGALLSFYKREKALYPCSLNDVIVLAVSRALLEFPVFLDQTDGEFLVRRDSVNIGLAVGLESGLVVPVLRHADSLNLKGIALETRRLIESAKAGKLEGVGEGVFTISNLGMYGVEEFSAIINPPESAILAVGAAREEVIVKDGSLRPGYKMTMTLSADHRTIDGTTSAQFMGRLKALLENPASLGGH